MNLDIQKIREALRLKLKSMGKDLLADVALLNLPQVMTEPISTAGGVEAFYVDFECHNSNYFLLITNGNADDVAQLDDFWACLYREDLSGEPMISITPEDV